MNNSNYYKGIDHEKTSLKEFNKGKMYLPRHNSNQVISNISSDSNPDNKDIITHQNETILKPSMSKSKALNISTYNSNKMKLSSIYIGNHKSSTQIKGFHNKPNIKRKETEIKSRNLFKNSFEKTTKYSNQVKRVSSVIPQLEDKIMTLCKIDESAHMKIGEIKNKFRKLERKNENLKKTKVTIPETVISIDFKDFILLSV